MDCFYQKKSLTKNVFFVVAKCVEVLLELIGDTPVALKNDKKKLEEDLSFFEKCKQQREQEEKKSNNNNNNNNNSSNKSSKDGGVVVDEVILAELKRKEDLEKRRQEEEQHFAQMRRDLEQEWLSRLKEQQRELEEKQRALEEERKAAMRKQLEVVAQQKNAEFKDQVEVALKKRLVELQSSSSSSSSSPSSSLSSVAVSASAATAPAPALSSDVMVELTCPSEAEMGSLMTVYWEYKTGRPSMSDWIGFYKRSRPVDSNDYYVYQKTGGSEKGKLEFVVPKKLGICEVRLFQNNSYKMVARSGPIRVGNDVKLAASIKDGVVNVAVTYSNKSKQHSTWDWLGLYRVEETDNRSYHDGMCAYVTKDVVPFQAPRKPGRYVVRYFQSGSGYSELAQSNTFDVDDKDFIRIVGNETGKFNQGQTVEVAWFVESVIRSTKDCVALFREGENNPLVAPMLQPTHTHASGGSLKFELGFGLRPGRYEFAFISAKSSSLVIKRTPPFELLEKL